jgi:hypothetical protein
MRLFSFGSQVEVALHAGDNAIETIQFDLKGVFHGRVVDKLLLDPGSKASSRRAPE